MDPNHFNRELQKYKIVRLEDHYRPRYKRAESRPAIKSAPHSEATVVGKEKFVMVDDGSKSASFWELMESVLGDALTTAESKRFIEEMKRNHEGALENLNLEDLDTALA